MSANRAPVVASPIPDVNWTAGQSGSYTFSSSAFSDPDGNNLTADILQAESLIDGFNTEAVIADKGYVANAFIAAVEANKAHVVISPKSNRLNPRNIDWHRYRERNLVERFFNRLEQFRRIATRYDKVASSFLSFICLACTFIWLR